jgi:hypothetical protein
VTTATQLSPNPFDPLINGVIVASVVLFVASLGYAYRLRKHSQSGKTTAEKARNSGYVLIGLWVLLPPIWFFFEFQHLHPNMMENSFELARVKQAQDLGRNVWLSFVVVLAAIIGIKWPPGT